MRFFEVVLPVQHPPWPQFCRFACVLYHGAYIGI